ncbi:MAG: transposase [Gemmatimonadota bacterium]|nr:transposase [Gemmatimonadota bacterium]
MERVLGPAKLDQWEDSDDCDSLRADPLFKLSSGWAPQRCRALCSEPTMSRLENTLSRIEVARMTAALVDIFCRSFPAPPAAITRDIDDTCDAVYGHQLLSFFHAHYDTRCRRTGHAAVGVRRGDQDRRDPTGLCQQLLLFPYGLQRQHHLRRGLESVWRGSGFATRGLATQHPDITALRRPLDWTAGSMSQRSG